MTVSELLKTKTPEERAKLAKPAPKCALCGELLDPSDPAETHEVTLKKEPDKPEQSKKAEPD